MVVGPETALAAGVADRLRDAGLTVFGPNRSGARLESSKIFAKRFMERHEIPTARFAVVHSLAQARKALDGFRNGVVVKADGLAAGKGVVVCDDNAAATAVLTEWYEQNTLPGGGTDVVLEERMSGREISVFAISDGRAMIPIAAACDYKRAGDDDRGPNTGGMGAYSPPAGFPDNMFEIVRERIIGPVLRGLLAEDEVYRGVLYCGLMWTDAGPRVVEFNARFGDPETQVLMPRVAGDFARYLASAAEGALELDAARFSDDACVGVTLTTDRYPYENTKLTGLPAALRLPEHVAAFWGSSTLEGGRVASPGGRVLTVTASAPTVAEARGTRLRGHRRTQAPVPAQHPPGLPLRHRPPVGKCWGCPWTGSG